MSRLDPQDATVLFLDLQQDIMPNSATVSAERLRRTCGTLAKLCTLHDMPAVLSIVARAGPFIPEVLDPLGAPEQRPRSQTSAFADQGLVDALRSSGRKTLVLCGVASEIVVQLTALDALEQGFAVMVAVDACGGVDTRTEEAAWQRVGAAGGVLTSVVTIAAELAGDITTERGGQTIGLMYEAMG